MVPMRVKKTSRLSMNRWLGGGLWYSDAKFPSPRPSPLGEGDLSGRRYAVGVVHGHNARQKEVEAFHGRDERQIPAEIKRCRQNPVLFTPLPWHQRSTK